MSQDDDIHTNNGCSDEESREDDDEMNGFPVNKSGLSVPEILNPLDPFDERFYTGGEFDTTDAIYEPESQEQTSEYDEHMPRM
jgi:hypothetical protein